LAGITAAGFGTPVVAQLVRRSAEEGRAAAYLAETARDLKRLVGALYTDSTPVEAAKAFQAALEGRAAREQKDFLTSPRGAASGSSTIAPADAKNRDFWVRRAHINFTEFAGFFSFSDSLKVWQAARLPALLQSPLYADAHRVDTFLKVWQTDADQLHGRLTLSFLELMNAIATLYERCVTPDHVDPRPTKDEVHISAWMAKWSGRQ
jgi:hypothetical protein